MKYIITEEIHKQIKKIYRSGTYLGQVKEFAIRINFPRWKITRYAITHGWTAKQHKEPNWIDSELKILERNARFTPAIIQRKLKAKGFKRSEVGIVLKRKRLRLLKNLDGISATGLAKLLNVDSHNITDAIKKEWLKASMRETKRTEKQGGDIYFIKYKDIKEYIQCYCEEIDFRLIDKRFVVDLLSGFYD